MSFLSENVFSSVDTRCYFEGLLPEGFTRKSIAEEGVRQAVKDAALELKQSGFSEAGKIAEGICVNLCSPAVTD